MTARTRRPDAPAPAYSHVRRTPDAIINASLEEASPTPFWLDSPDRPPITPPLAGTRSVDLAVVGGGYAGLWTALMAKERDPGRSVILLEAEEVGWAASGRNGGFCESSLTHGPTNGERHFAGELATIERLADENFSELEAALTRYGIDAEYENTGVLVAATEPHQVDELRAAASAAADGEFLDRDAVHSVIQSPLYLAGMRKTAGYSFVNPAKLAWGLKRACLELGVEIVERTPVTALRRRAHGIELRTPHGSVQAGQVALATNGFRSLLLRNRWRTVPIYDYVLVTEPLTESQLQSIGWTSRHGITDSSHQFHYSRLTADNRILWGGFDAVYHLGGRVEPRHDQRRETFEVLADHFFSTFPALTGVRFTHAWGGMIDMSSRLVAFHGLAARGRVAYSAGYTGLGVGATRFGAAVMLDLLSGHETDRTRLQMVRSKPIPVPPEPFAYPLIQLVRRAVARADANHGRPGLILRAMDAIGVSFDS